MICDCGGVMIYDGERWECPECGASFDYENYEGEDEYSEVLE